MKRRARAVLADQGLIVALLCLTAMGAESVGGPVNVRGCGPSYPCQPSVRQA